ncbi:hypothetical protein MMC17_009380 [Xylographa soralifera]|nr:hypothetical protein [Xylographa soralifera]
MAPGILQNGVNGVHGDDGHLLNGVQNLVQDNTYSVTDLDGIEQAGYEPIAVIGFSLKFPQDATSSEAFWKMMTEKRCSMTEWPKERLNLDAFYHPDSSRPDTIPFKGGHFLEEPLGNFDAPFFSITPNEAAAIDPQHRLLLETAYRAFENAGISLEKASGSKTSVYTGCFADDYRLGIVKDPDLLPTYSATGVAITMLAARLSWFFNLSGPCVNLDSACSSSMMALDLACQGLRNKDSDMALVGGANLLISLEFSLMLSNMGFISHDSRSFSFDHRGNGYGRGEGLGVIVLKRLTDALRDGDTIRAVVRSTGSNQDGRTPGITQPNQEAQEILINDTYAKAGLDMQTTRYVEAHGTGTSIGDPIEASAIGRAFRKYRSAKEPMYIGAVKSNIGHLEGASGVADIDADSLKITFPLHNTPWPCRGLRRASISSFGFGGSNSHAIIDDAYNFLRLRHLDGNHWTAHEPPSLEYLEQCLESPKLFTIPRNSSQQALNGESGNMRPHLLVWSTADEGGLARLAESYDAHVPQLATSLSAAEASAYLSNLAYTLAIRRSSLNWKSFAIARSIFDLHDLRKKISKPVRSRVDPKLAYVFTGQGAQFARMSKDLFGFPAYLNSLRRSEMYFDGFGCRWSLLSELLKDKDTSNINDPAYSQPICTALQVALVDLLRSFNVVPSAVVGHSSGEIAAAYCVGGLSHRSACKVAFFRGLHAAKLSESSKFRGAMISVGLSEDAVEPYLEQLSANFGSHGVTVGCINSPKNVTVTGSEPQVDKLKSLLEKDQVFARKLMATVAYHSSQMEEIAAEYLSSIGDLEGGDPPTTDSVMVSSVSCKILTLDDIQQGEYWVRNMTSPVRFSAALEQMCSGSRKNSKTRFGAIQSLAEINLLLEIGPHSAMRGPIKDIFIETGQESISYDSVMVRGVSAQDTLLDAVGRLACSGYPVDILEVNCSGTKPVARMVLPNLPEYPFDHSQSHWHESRYNREGLRFREQPRLDLLGSAVPDWNPLDARWRKIVRISETPWVEDHKVNGSPVYPAAGMLVMAMEACKQLANEDRRITGYTIKDATFNSPLPIAASGPGVEVQLCLRTEEDSFKKDSVVSDFRLYMNKDGHWDENCRGSIQLEYGVSESEVDAGKENGARLHRHRQLFEQAATSCDRSVPIQKMYERLGDFGLGCGPAFQGIQQLFYNDTGEATGKVRVFQWIVEGGKNHPQQHIIHPTTLDSLFQLMLVALSKGTEENMPTMMITRVTNLWISGGGISYPDTSTVNVYGRAIFTGNRKGHGHMFALDPITSELLLSIEKTEATTVANRDAPVESQGAARRLCYSMDWKPDLDLVSNQQALKYCESARPHRESTTDFFEDLGYALVKFMSDTLDQLRDQKEESCQSYLQNYIQWMEYKVRRFHASDLPGLSADNSKWTALLQEVQSWETVCQRLERTVQGKFFVRIGRNLLQILRGNLDPLTFMFEDDSVPEFYRDVNSKVICYEPLYKYLDTMSHKNPGLKILEIGSGTGSSTDFILNALKDHDEDAASIRRCSQYDYTDISPAFFEAAGDRYKRYSDVVKFKVLDIELDPAEQGFDVGSYDLIIAASVLHATRNIENTMRNARKLLKHGGKFLIFEVAQDTSRAGFAFGLLPGWWLSEEDYRQNGPIISVKEWHNLTLRTGFSGIDLEFPDYFDQASHEYSIMVTTAVDTKRDENADMVKNRLRFPKTLIIIIEASSIQQQLAHRLKDALISYEGTECNIVSLERASEMADLRQRFCFFLVEVEEPQLADLDAHAFVMVQHLITTVPGLIWTTNGGGNAQGKPHTHLVDGLSRVARTESNRLIFVTVALEKATTGTDSPVGNILRVFEDFLAQSEEDFESEYREKDGMLEIGRVLESDNLNQEIKSKNSSHQHSTEEFGRGPPLALQIASPGLLNSLQFVEDFGSAKPLAPGEVEISVEASGVNFRDCLTALGQLDTKVLGGECSGVVSRAGVDCDLRPGDRVVALFTDTYRTFARGPAQCVNKIPDGMTYTEASALPVVFFTAWYGLCDVARLQPGESILIHAAAGGTGQAAIQVAKHVGAEIYVTVGSDEKKKLLMDTYAIPEDHILFSRNTSFAQGILRMTGNRGVDVILNSLSGEGLVASWECLAPFGRFVEIGKRDINSHGNLPMWQFDKNATFSAIDILPIMAQRPSFVRRTLEAIMSLIKSKKFHTPQPLQIFGISEIESAFRHFQSGRNSGKMVIEMRKHDMVHTVIETKPDYHFDEHSSYLIAGGLGGLGRSAARWMVNRGVRNLILLSRSGAQSESAVTLIEELKAKGAHVEAPACDITKLDMLRTVLERCARTMPPVKGVIQGSMVLSDAILEKMTFEDWITSTAPKVQGSWNLHSLLPQGMDFFICLSSIAGVVGSGGQAIYAAGNTFMDALTDYRVSRGEKGTSLDLGWMESEGVVAESSFLSTSMAAGGSFMPISQAEFFALLDHYCNPDLDTVSASATQAIIGLEIPATMHAKNLKEPHWMQRRTFRHLHHMGQGQQSTSSSEKSIDYAAALRDASSLEDAGRVVTECLVQKLIKSLSIPREDLDTTKPLHKYGVDSLLAVELRNYFAKELSADVAIFDIMGAASIDVKPAAGYLDSLRGKHPRLAASEHLGSQAPIPDKALRSTQEKLRVRGVALHGPIQASVWHCIDITDSLRDLLQAGREDEEEVAPERVRKVYSFKEVGGAFADLPVRVGGCHIAAGWRGLGIVWRAVR